jgi:hypothetical protein
MTQQQPEYPGTASTLAIVGGALMLVSGILILGISAFVSPAITSFFSQNVHFVTHGNVTSMIVNNSTTYTFTGNNHGYNGTFPFQTFVPAFVSGITAFVGAIGLVSGAMVIVSGAMLRSNPSQRSLWGVLVLVFSCLSFFGFGGFIIGAVLGIIAGIMALTWKPSVRATAT